MHTFIAYTLLSLATLSAMLVIKVIADNVNQA